MNLYLISYSEIGLKGENRWFFEDTLVKRIKEALKDFEDVNISKTHGRIYLKVKAPKEEVLKRLRKVFGINTTAVAFESDLDLEKIKETVIQALMGADLNGKTFKIESRRANKAFPLSSIELNRILGEHVLKNFQGLKVDVHNPQVVVHIEIREKAYVYCEKIPGPGGLPVGTSGKALLLLSGGIDSPVAGYLMMKRGATLEAVYFHSFPFTSDRAKEKVIKLCKVLAEYGGQIVLHVVNFTEVIKELAEKCPNDYLTIMMRRMMVRVAEQIAKKVGAKVLVTGESLGQVASQTMESIVAVDEAASMPILRPLIGFDKVEIIDLSKKIGTYEISIEPYADCCTIFVPKKPETKPKLHKVKQFEENLNLEKLVEHALAETEVIKI
ncbi:tRNA uracil 4-sulfurtransferase ThiI [Pseudothermotoga thermarum]|uniref:Probable tRNA sulfurtransferase n=1 Tax=Pseudothermotoga thermarum DSM 5069 TaxID=688269 RepID=F7YUK5_9THEM|nr:tRNA uracil 4-sulfurtransferase ThiI [Pseudothermotoga thermarum]AEH51477.1 thiamine biosynthesis/tRNA modification protein ThiI [Pseudothermotoga thermarum DSM 5069]